MLGGNGAEAGFRVAVDAAGSVYVTGVTTSTNFPTTPGAFQTAPAGGSCSNGFTPIPCTDVFVAKLNAVGTELMYVTYFGGSGLEEARDIAVDAAGNAYITGKTASLDLPTANALQRANGAISLVKSTDGGNTWRASGVGLPLNNVSALAVDPLTPTTVYAVAAGQGVYKSVDGGATWVASNTGLSDADISSLVIDPVTPSTILEPDRQLAELWRSRFCCPRPGYRSRYANCDLRRLRLLRRLQEHKRRRQLESEQFRNGKFRRHRQLTDD